MHNAEMSYINKMFEMGDIENLRHAETEINFLLLMVTTVGLVQLSSIRNA
jgi:hypothetical protein